MKKKKRVQVTFNETVLWNGDEIYAVFTCGHNPMREHLKTVNDGWDQGWADEENTFYQYIAKRKRYFRVNCSPKEKGASPVTISYWEEPYPKQKAHYHKRKK